MAIQSTEVVSDRSIARAQRHGGVAIIGECAIGKDGWRCPGAVHELAAKLAHSANRLIAAEDSLSGLHAIYVEKGERGYVLLVFLGESLSDGEYADKLDLLNKTLDNGMSDAVQSKNSSQVTNSSNRDLFIFLELVVQHAIKRCDKAGFHPSPYPYPCAHASPRAFEKGALCVDDDPILVDCQVTEINIGKPRTDGTAAVATLSTDNAEVARVRVPNNLLSELVSARLKGTTLALKVKPFKARLGGGVAPGELVAIVDSGGGQTAGTAKNPKRRKRESQLNF